MNWHYDNPVSNGDYLCCVVGYSAPITITWYNGEWGHWDMSRGNGWHPVDEGMVICYTGFDEIPMPENW